MVDTLHVAYARDKHGCHARGYISREGFNGKIRSPVGWGETPEDAIAELICKDALQAASYGIAKPSSVVNHGRMAYTKANALLF